MGQAEARIRMVRREDHLASSLVIDASAFDD
jgi:hypothetical protein